MHGCGIKLCHDDSGGAVTQAGLFVNDEFAGTSSVCDLPAAQLAAKQAVGAASLACGLEVRELSCRYSVLLPGHTVTDIVCTCSHNKRHIDWRKARQSCAKGAV